MMMMMCFELFLFDGYVLADAIDEVFLSVQDT
jgi:hypothetical protein